MYGRRSTRNPGPIDSHWLRNSGSDQAKRTSQFRAFPHADMQTIRKRERASASSDDRHVQVQQTLGKATETTPDRPLAAADFGNDAHGLILCPKEA